MISNVATAPKVWSPEELEIEAQKALDEFVDRRLAEPGGKYLEHVTARRAAIVRLFKMMSGFDPADPPASTIREILADEQLFAALRYVAGPPVSEDDLGVLVTRSVKGLSAASLQNDETPVALLNLICKLADPFRFPWIAADREPTRRELHHAITATMTLHATQSLQTERRGFGKLVEHRLEQRLIELGFIKVTPFKGKKGEKPPAGTQPYPPKGKITQPTHHPTYPHFYGECVVYGRKVDQFIALRTGRMIALEAKDSSSALNSTKRLLNDTAAKARHYTEAAGKNVISVALLSGVFKVSDLSQAQESKLYLVWAHELDDFIDWIKSQT